MSSLDFRPVEVGDDDIERVVGFLKAVWPEAKKLTTPYVRWLYRDNPSGRAIGVNAWAGDVIAGHYVVVPISARVNGQSVPGALSLNTAVHADFRGQGLFTSLAAETFELASSLGVDHVIGVANANSTPGFIRKLDFQLVRQLDARAFVGTPLRTAPTQSPAWEREWPTEHLRWRLSNPAFRYTTQRNGPFYEIDASTPFRGVRVAARFESADEALARLGDVKHRRVRFPRLWIGTSPTLRFSAAKSISAPQRLRKIPLNLVFRSLAQPGTLLPSDSVEFSALDFDLM
jgi:GNAT superfamily N-acetyltransferase